MVNLMQKNRLLIREFFLSLHILGSLLFERIFSWILLTCILPLASILFYRNHLDEEFKLFKKVKIKHQIIFKIVLRCLKKETTSRFNWQLFKLMH